MCALIHDIGDFWAFSTPADFERDTLLKWALEEVYSALRFRVQEDLDEQVARAFREQEG